MQQTDESSQMAIQEGDDGSIPATQPIQREEAMETPDSTKQPTQRENDQAEE